MINPVKSFLTHGPLILKEIYTINKYINIYIYIVYIYTNIQIYTISHIVFFFFCRIPVVLENGRSSHTRSAPGSGLVNFVPESRLPFVEMSSIYRKTAVKA